MAEWNEKAIADAIASIPQVAQAPMGPPAPTPEQQAATATLGGPAYGPPPPPAPRRPATLAEINASTMSTKAAPQPTNMLQLSEPGQRMTPMQLDKMAAGRVLNEDLSGVRDPSGGSMQLTMPTQVGPQSSVIPPLVNHSGGWQAGLGGIKPKDEEAMMETFGNEAKASEKVSRVQAQTATVIGDMMDQAAEQSQQHMAHRAVMQAERDAQVDAAIQRRAELSAKQAEMNPDGSRFWHSPGSIFMAIGAAISGKGMDRLDNAIKMDLDQQKTEFDQQGEKAKSQDTLIAQYDKVFADRNQRDKAAQADAYENAARRMTAFAERSKAPEIMAQAELNSQRLMGHAAMLRGQLDQMDHYKAYTTGGAAGKKDLSNIFMGADGKKYVAKNAESRKIAAASNVTYSNIVSALDDYQAALKKLSSKDLAAYKIGVTTSAMSEAQTAYNHALSPMRQAQDDGVWKKGEVEMLAQTLTPPDHFSGDPNRQADLAKKQAAKVNSHVMQIEDATPVEEGFGYDAAGAFAPVAKYTGEQQVPMKTGMPSGFKAIGGK